MTHALLLLALAVGVIHDSSSYVLSDADPLVDGTRRLEAIGVEVLGMTMPSEPRDTRTLKEAWAPFSVVVARVPPASEKDLTELVRSLASLQRDAGRTFVLLPHTSLAKDPAATLKLARAVRAARPSTGVPFVLAAMEVKSAKILTKSSYKEHLASVDLVGLDASHLVARPGEGDATLAKRVRRFLKTLTNVAPRGPSGAFISRFGAAARVVGRERAWQHARAVASEAAAAGLAWALYDGLYDRSCEGASGVYRPGGGGRPPLRDCEGRALVAWDGTFTTIHDALLPFLWPATTVPSLTRLFARYRPAADRGEIAATAEALRGKPDRLAELVVRLRSAPKAPVLDRAQEREHDGPIAISLAPPAGSRPSQAPLLLGAGLGGWPELHVAGDSGPGELVFPESWRGGVRVAVARAKNGVIYRAVAAGPGHDPEVRVVAGGVTVAAFRPYERQLRGGVHVALGDVNGDGIPDLITGPGMGGPPRVRVFDLASGLLIRDFLAPFGDEFSGGVRVAAGDLDGDGQADIITAPGPGGGPIVSVYAGKDNAQLLHTHALSNTEHRGGLHLAVGRFASNGPPMIVVGAGVPEDEGPVELRLPGEPRVRVLKLDGTAVAEFIALDRGRSVRVATTDFDGDGLSDIVACTGADAAPFARVTKGLGREELAIIHLPGSDAFLGGCHAGGAHAP